MSKEKQCSKADTYPARILIEGNRSTINDLCGVVATFTDDNLKYKHQDSRTIAEIIQHIICSQNCMYLNSFVLGKKTKCNCHTPKTVKEAIKAINGLDPYFAEVVNSLESEDYQVKFKTEWGQELTKELALFQSVTHTSYHISEICFLAGLGGFYKNTMG